ncbi:monocarboxylate transporter 12-like isoform X2 [Mya arenaria]|uniref:monocarboxylate transporter 12-like isoform X2 n=1 Tax=Mya arenaria TaxID=6604 RepID=UPI0022E7B550|nr:monocarboxylate transporter 12-like isoform X2 [Mya arenaria]
MIYSHTNERLAKLCDQLCVNCWGCNSALVVYFYLTNTSKCVLMKGVFIGGLIHKFGERNVAVCLSFILSTGVVISYFAMSIPFLMISIGLLGGTSGDGIYIAASAATGRHIHGKQGTFFVSVVNVGSGMGGVIFLYFFDYLTDRFGPRGTYLITGGILLNMIPFTLLWNSPTTKKLTKPKHVQNVCDDNAIEMESLTSVKSEVKPCYAGSDTLCVAFKKLVTDKVFVFFAFGLATAYSCVTVVNVVDALQNSGLSQTNATLGLLLLNISGIIGLPGSLIQIKYVTVLTVPIIACIMIILSQLGITLLSSITTNFLACILAGTAIGMLVSCFGVVTLKLVGIERHTNAMGICLSLSGLTNAFMGQFGGWIRDKLGYYTIPCLLSASVEVLAIILLSIAQFYRSKYPKRLIDELKDVCAL